VRYTVLKTAGRDERLKSSILLASAHSNNWAARLHEFDSRCLRWFLSQNAEFSEENLSLVMTAEGFDSPTRLQFY